MSAAHSINPQKQVIQDKDIDNVIDHFKAVFSVDLIHNKEQSELESEIKLFAKKIEIENKKGLIRRNFCTSNDNLIKKNLLCLNSKHQILETGMALSIIYYKDVTE